MVRHFLDVDGAATLPTDSLPMVERAVTDLIATQAMGTGARAGRYQRDLSRSLFCLQRA